MKSLERLSKVGGVVVSIDRISKEKEKIQQMLPPGPRLAKKSPRVSSPGARGDAERVCPFPC